MPEIVQVMEPPGGRLTLAMQAKGAVAGSGEHMAGVTEVMVMVPPVRLSTTVTGPL